MTNQTTLIDLKQRFWREEDPGEYSKLIRLLQERGVSQKEIVSMMQKKENLKNGKDCNDS